MAGEVIIEAEDMVLVDVGKEGKSHELELARASILGVKLGPLAWLRS